VDFWALRWLARRLASLQDIAVEPQSGSMGWTSPGAVRPLTRIGRRSDERHFPYTIAEARTVLLLFQKNYFQVVAIGFAIPRMTTMG
jgi:hypothetical protein